ncbi:MAG: hypothetical protein HUU15_16290 [Candidatus Brocadiae bacterium]|nr:hypothetical protein [Candidatus Brocadiia bacterium]
MADSKTLPARRAFDARVENPWNEVALHKDAGFFESRRVRKRMEKLIEGVSSALTAAGLEVPYWPEEGGVKPAAHLMIDRTGVLTDLKKYAAKLEGTDLAQVMVGKTAETRFPNLLRHRERNSYYWPVDFEEPVWVNADGTEPIPVGSSGGLLRELAEINTVLKVEKTFRMQKMVDFMDADEREIAKIETFMDVSGTFWIKFGFLVIRKLAEKSEKTNLPIIFG